MDPLADRAFASCPQKRLSCRRSPTDKHRAACLIVDAWHILLLIKLGREVPNLQCPVVFEEYEWKALHCFVNQTQSLPDKEPALQEIIRMVAQLGGFLTRRHDGQPGSMTLWHSLQRLTDITATWKIMSTLSELTKIYG